MSNLPQAIESKFHVVTGPFIDAAKAYDKKSLELFGDNSRLNFGENYV